MMGISKAIVITYQMPKDKLYEEFRTLVAKSEWNSSGWREGNEAEGTRDLLGLSTDALAQDCGPDYPEDLECLAGGTYQRTVDMMGISKAIVITYQMPKDKLYEEFRTLVAKSEWNSSGWREGNEAEGT